MGFFRQEYWIGLPFPPPPGPRDRTWVSWVSCIAGGFFTTEPPRELYFLIESERRKWSCSVVSNSLRPHGLQPTRLLSPWDSPGKNTGVGCHFLLQGIFWTQGSNPGVKPGFQALEADFNLWATREAHFLISHSLNSGYENTWECRLSSSFLSWDFHIYNRKNWWREISFNCYSF